MYLLLLNSQFLQASHWFVPTLTDLHDMFLKMPPVLEKMLRPTVVYVFLVAALRLAGKRELAQLNPFDLVVLLTLSNTVQNAIIGDDNSVTGGVVGATTLLGINYLVVRFLFKHRRLDQLVEGKPTKLIEQGRLQRQQLAKELLTESELLTLLHRHGFASLKDVETCVLEPGGTFFIEGREPSRSEKRHAEICERLDNIGQQLAALQKR